MIVKLCDARELPPENEMKAFRGGSLEICVARHEGGMFAFDNDCPHQKAPLSSGHLDGSKVVCPYHAWRFDIADGCPEIAGDPSLVLYEIRQYDDEVFIKLPDVAGPVR
jgi:nitrite reductase/ring-hydroxylating ferredoxin subunit